MNVINIFVGFNVIFLWKIHQGYIKGVKKILTSFSYKNYDVIN